MSGGSSRGQEPSIYRDNLGQALSHMDSSPSAGKRSFPAKDVSWRVKRSQSEVEGTLAAVPRPGSLMDRDQDRAMHKARQLHACPLAQGEGLTVSALALGARVAEVTRRTQSRGKG